jgi:putative ubiquitin-RnfH superfamily antitoxin RatB of RatAB toxin-antitoxin module
MAQARVEQAISATTLLDMKLCADANHPPLGLLNKNVSVDTLIPLSREKKIRWQDFQPRL